MSENELILTRAVVDDLRDRLYVLRCAIEDVERDLAGDPTAAELGEAVQWLLEAARPLSNVLDGESPVGT